MTLASTVFFPTVILEGIRKWSGSFISRNFGFLVSCPCELFQILELCHSVHVLNNFEFRSFSGLYDVSTFSNLVRDGLQRLGRVGNKNKAYILKWRKAELIHFGVCAVH